MTAAVTRPDLFTTARPFFHEVLRLKASIHVAMPDGSIEPGIESAPVAARVRAMQQSLLTLLRTDLRPEPEREELQALLVAFADEAFTSVLWPGRNLWRLEPLEHALFHGRSVTSRIFERLDALLQRNQPADAPLATVYLAALALGFTGTQHAPRIPVRRYREDLALFLARHDPVPARYSRHLFPDAYVTAPRQVPPAPRRARWPIVVAVGAMALVLLSHLLWISLTSDLWTLTERIVTMARP